MKKVIRHQLSVISNQFGVKLLVLSFYFLLLTLNCFAQVGINTTGATPNSSAMLDVISTNMGVLIPRMNTTQRGNITFTGSIPESLLIFNTDTKCFEFYANGSWQTGFCGCTPPAQAGTITGTATVCQNKTGFSYQVPSIAGATDYMWIYNTGSGFTIATGTKTNSITANFSADATSGNLIVFGVSNGCGNGAFSPNYAITVNPSPVVTTANTAICCSGTGPNISLTASVASSFSWTIGAITGSITGANPGSGSTINQPLTNLSNTTAGTVQYIITPTSTTGSCIGSAYTITVTVNPAPTVTTANTTTICSGTGTNISLTASIASNYTWSAGAIVGSITGTGTGSGATINQTLTNPSNSTAGTVQYIVTPTSTAGSCVGSAYTITVTVNPIPAAPTAGTNTPSATQIVWNWSTVSGATSYQWSTSITYPGTGVHVVSNSYTQGSLLCGNAYTLYVWSYNACNYSTATMLSSSTSACIGQIAYTTPGSYTWTCPAGVTSVCVVCVGGGGSTGPYSYYTEDPNNFTEAGGAGGGGGLGYKNNYAVTPGSTYSLVVGAPGTGPQILGGGSTNGGDSYFVNTSTVWGQGGRSGGAGYAGGAGGSYAGDGGGSGGKGGNSSAVYPGQAGGAGGYSGNGGPGGNAYTNSVGTAGTGGGGGSSSDVNGAGGSGGGGVGIYGLGSNGAGGVAGGHGGSGGSGGGNGGDPGASVYPSGRAGGSGGAYGGAGGVGNYGGYTGYNLLQQGVPGTGAVRIIWGSGRAFPSTLTTDQ